MAFRSIIVNKATKISIDLNNIVIRYQEDDFWINIEEISNIVIEDPRCLVSLRLLSKLCEKGINVVFTNESHMSVGSLCTLFNNSRATKKYINQINWDDRLKEFLWTRIVINKIINQKNTLIKLNKNKKISILDQYINNITSGDKTNREGLASRTYFKELFGETFKRFDEDIINFCLNYIYQIVRSKIAQEIVSCGYQPSLGINHKSEFNSFNLADDFIEVFRPILDFYVYKILNATNENFLTPDIKQNLVNILNERIIYNDNSYKIHTVIQFFVQDLFSFLETGAIEKIRFPKLL